MEPKKRLIVQSYIEDDIDRGTNFTYKQFPSLERASKKCFKQYALRNKVDYELITKSDRPNYNSAHWLRMEMFHRPEYDEILYVDCDVLVHPKRMDDNIFDYEGNAVPRVHPLHTHINLPEHNMGVFKFNREEAEIMRDNIDKYYHPTHNQKSLNKCWFDNVGEFKRFPYKFNVTHRMDHDLVFRHYAGSHKNNHDIRFCRIYKYWR